MARATAATSLARCVSGVAAVLIWPFALGCSGADSHGETSTQPRDDAQAIDVRAADTGRPPPGDAGLAEADAQPTTSFDGALVVYPGLCNLGEIGATFRGIPAYCQPTSAMMTGFYQCDELANRFMRDALQHPDLDNVVTDYASTICDRASTTSAYSVWGPDYGATTGLTPVGGDLVVFPGTPGHVAVIVGFTSETEATILQENGGPSTASIEWDPVSSFIVDAECWVHAEAAPPAELPDGSACECFTGGDTCGLAIVDHEWWNGCVAGAPEGGFEYGALYRCDGGSYAKIADCADLCITPNLYDASGYCGH
jgi:hypothetical protein